MPDAFILSAARTPIGRARKGSLVSVDAYQLAEVAVTAAVERSQVPVADLDDLFLAEPIGPAGMAGSCGGIGNSERI
jgi:acetyl-CoA acetyltransferase